jgi:hypothetical protein
MSCRALMRSGKVARKKFFEARCQAYIPAYLHHLCWRPDALPGGGENNTLDPLQSRSVKSVSVPLPWRNSSAWLG